MIRAFFREAYESTVTHPKSAGIADYVALCICVCLSPIVFPFYALGRVVARMIERSKP